jgi:DNA-directed RNA polymerases I, II, and III subunit RPABC2
MADEDAYHDEVEDTEDLVETFGEVVDEIDSGDLQIRPELRKLYNQHPELIVDYIESVIPQLASKDNHRTYPFITLYEKTKIVGLRANQLSQGAKAYISVPDHISSVREIARMELEQKRLPFIVKRPLPNGKSEYWRLADLMILT